MRVAATHSLFTILRRRGHTVNANGRPTGSRKLSCYSTTHSGLDRHFSYVILNYLQWAAFPPFLMSGFSYGGQQWPQSIVLVQGQRKGERGREGRGGDSSQNFHYSVLCDNYSIVLLVVELLTMLNLLIQLYHRYSCIGNNT